MVYVPDAPGPAQRGPSAGEAPGMIDPGKGQLSNAGISTSDIAVRRATVDRAVSGPGYEVPDGAIVEISPLSSNAAIVYFSTVGPDAAMSSLGPRSGLGISALPRRLRVRNLSEIWVYSGTIGEGVNITLQREH